MKIASVCQLPYHLSVAALSSKRYTDMHSNVPQTVDTERAKWGLYDHLTRPSFAGSNISCGVRQMYNLHAYPPSLSALLVILMIHEGNRFSSVIFSDTEHGHGSFHWDEHTKKLYTKTEIEKLSTGVDCGIMIADLIDKSKGVLGSVSGSQQTHNRNTSNRIRTYIWTIPHPDFKFSEAISYINEYRERDGAQ